MLSTDVKLPRDFEAKFPEHCIRCQGETFRNTLRIGTHDLRLSGLLFWFMIGKKAVVEVPCCQSCGFRMRMQRWISGFATLLLILIGAFLLFPMLQSLPQPFRRISMIVVGLLCISPVIFKDVIWPPTFDLTSTKKSITYEFKDPEVAHAFAELNEDAPWMEIE